MNPPSRRLVIRGIAASPGVTVGTATLFDRRRADVPQRHVGETEIDAEIARLRNALEESRREIELVGERLGATAPAEYRLILEAHLMMHRDELLVDGSIRSIRDELVNAEWAVRKTIDGIVGQLSQAQEGYFRERADDVAQVGERILRALTGTEVRLPTIEGPTVLVASDLSPADAAALVRQPIEALVVSDGSATSHTAILARTLEIPAVVGVPEVTRLVGAGDVVLVDALRGEIIIEPEETERARAEERGRRFRLYTGKLRARRGVRSATRDGVKIEMHANIELPAEAAMAVEEGADGVGLYRTEFIYLDRPALPTEDEQTQIYSDVVRVMAPRPVIFRTFDLGGDKLPLAERAPRGANPALGLRAIRLSLSRPAVFRAQVRAILRAAVHGPVKLMFPLVTTVDELRRARALADEWRAELAAEGIDHRPVPIGIMLEVPSAVVIADVLARECDFFSVGTNDLVQYSLALDRTNPMVAYLARTLDPAVLRLLHMALISARLREIPIGMCGDMAADPIALPIVVGLGYRNLSMPASAVPLAREVLARIDTTEAHEVAMRALTTATADEVEQMVIERFRDTLGEVWSEHGIDLSDEPPPSSW